MRAIYQNLKFFFTETEEHVSPAAFIVAIVTLLTFVGTSFYIMALSLTS